MSSPATTVLLSLKIILISTGAISIAMAIKFSVPSIIAFMPTVWNGLLAWLRPPYLYFIVNGIIITIAASSWYSHHQQGNNLTSEKTPPPSSEVVPAKATLAEREAEPKMNVVEALPAPPPPAEEEEEEEEPVVEELYHEANVVEVRPVVVNGVLQIEEADEDDDVANGDWMSSGSNSTLPQEIPSLSTDTELHSLLPVKENQKHRVSLRFGHQKPIKISPEGGGRTLRVARPNRHETLENTWKMITEGRHVPRTRQFKKSNTWENHGREVAVNSLDHDCPTQHVLKSETFRDRTNYDVPTSFSSIPGQIKREPSPSRDELNRRVEAFINKFNEEMRLQRQESLQKHMEMINRGAY